MQVQVHGKQIDVGSALRSATEEGIAASVTKYFDRDASAIVTYAKENHEFSCDCFVHLASGLTLHTSGAAGDARIALDLASARLEKRLRRYKSRLKDHHGKAEAQIETVMAQDYVIEDSRTELRVRNRPILTL